MTGGSVDLTISGGVASVLFNRPQSQNAMTFAMYDRLEQLCAQISADSSIRAVVFRGAGEAFVAGTDINEFRDFKTAEDGIRYESRMERTFELVERIAVPTLAVVTGAAMGGGLVLAVVCDLRLITPRARFGVPIARTLGNCLSVANTARLVASLGVNRAKRMLLLAEIMDAGEAVACGFALEAVAPEEVDKRAAELAAVLSSNAPLTLHVAKEAIRRLAATGLPNGDDLVRLAYGSGDFKEGVSAFLEKRRPRWTGR
jgi:enoyl-CoA hydratase/carnithine racemase